MRRTFIAIAAALATLSSAQAAQSVEADNGLIYRVIEITHGRSGSAQASVYSPEDDLLSISFDCAGHMMIYSTDAHSFGPSQTVPPRSVAGKIAQLACAGAKADVPHAMSYVDGKYYDRATPKGWHSPDRQ